MADGIIELVGPRLPPTQTAAQIQPLAHPTYRWIKVFDMREELRGCMAVAYQNSKGTPELELAGKKINVRTERRSERILAADWAALVIQKNARYGNRGIRPG